VAQKLMEKETLEAEEFKNLMEQAGEVEHKG
jgi:ATP-dependent Zn protease